MAAYTPQYKLHIAKEAIQAKTYTETSKKYGIETKRVKEWASAYQKYGDLAFEEDGPRRYSETRIHDLEKELEDLKEENEI